jgi:cysteine synthase A
MKANSILDLIGKTPHLRTNRLFPTDYDVWIKLEKQNPGGSIKDRIAAAMIEAAEKKGALKQGMEIIEPTSGNTGIGLAMVAAVKGYPITLCMPESASIERRRIMLAYGANLVITPKEKGIKGSIEKANELKEKSGKAWIPNQFDNPVNVDIHAKTTAEEILADFPGGLDAIITGVGTGGHITGVARVLKKKFPNLKVYAVEPDLSPVLSGGTHTPHPIQGIGTGFIPSILDRSLLDGIIQVSKEEAFEYTRRAAKEEALFCGVSTGATLAAIAKKLPEIMKGATILGFNYDTGERYLSVDGLFPNLPT